MSGKLFMSKYLLWLGILFSILFANVVQAAVFCSVTSPGFSTAYVTANTTTNVTATSFSVTCTKDAAGRRATSTVSYQVTAGNGLNATGTQNRANKLTSFINYSVSTVPTCATAWKGTTVLPTVAASFVMAMNTTVTNTYTFYGCILPLQVATAPVGNYTDTVTMTIARAGGGGGGRVTYTSGSFPVTIVAPATCTLTTPPTNLAFSYTAFRPTAALTSATYGVTCSTLLPYTMSLDTTIGVVTGLNYTLALNTVAAGGASPLASVGTGVAQSFFVNGSMAAGQAGTCTTAICTGAQVRTLTITY